MQTFWNLFSCRLSKMFKAFNDLFRKPRTTVIQENLEQTLKYLILLFNNKGPTILDKIFVTKQWNPVKTDRNRKLWYLFLRGFNCYRQGLISWGGTGGWAICPVRFEISLIFRQFQRSYVLSWSASHKQLVYQVCYTRYQVSFYLWWIRPVLKYCKVSKYYNQDGRLLFRKVLTNSPEMIKEKSHQRWFKKNCCGNFWKM